MKLIVSLLKSNGKDILIKSFCKFVKALLVTSRSLFNKKSIIKLLKTRLKINRFKNFKIKSPFNRFIVIHIIYYLKL